MTTDSTATVTSPAPASLPGSKKKKRAASAPKAPPAPRVQRTPEEQRAHDQQLLKKAELRAAKAAARAAELRDRLAGKVPQQQRAKIAGRALRVLGDLRDRVFAGVDVAADHDPNSPDAERVKALQAICAVILACEAVEDGAL